MLNTEQTLSAAIAELRCISPDRRADLSELRALRVARASIDEMIRTCVDELRTDTSASNSWGAIAYALDEISPGAARRRFGEHRVDDDHVVTFWSDHVGQLTSEFLPSDFLFELYLAWIDDQADAPVPLPRGAFSRRLRAVAATSGWNYTRVRAASLIAPEEALASRIPHWSPIAGRGGVYGIRRVPTE